jgi:signal transduction histidine kinase
VSQECLHNIARHSGAKAARLTLTADKRDIVLSVADKGAGFDPDLVDSQSGLGLVGIRERMRLVGGSMSVRSRPGKGAKIEVRIPLDRVVP